MWCNSGFVCLRVNIHQPRLPRVAVLSWSPNPEFDLLLLMGDSDPAWRVREVVQRVVVRFLTADSATGAHSHRIQL